MAGASKTLAAVVEKNRVGLTFGAPHKAIEARCYFLPYYFPEWSLLWRWEMKKRERYAWEKWLRLPALCWRFQRWPAHRRGFEKKNHDCSATQKRDIILWNTFFWALTALVVGLVGGRALVRGAVEAPVQGGRVLQWKRESCVRLR